MSIVSSRTLALIAALALTVAVTACGKKEEAKKADPKAAAGAKAGEKGAEKGADKPGEAAKKADDMPALDPKKMDGKQRVAKSKVLVDKMAGEMQKMVTEVEAAKGDRTKIQSISDKFKAFAEKHRSEGEALSQAMSPEEKAELSEYAKKKLAPLMSKMMAELMKARAGDEGAAAAGKAPAGEGAGKEGAKPAGDAAKPEGGKPEGGKPEAAKPEAAKPAAEEKAAK